MIIPGDRYILWRFSRGEDGRQKKVPVAPPLFDAKHPIKWDNPATWMTHSAAKELMANPLVSVQMGYVLKGSEYIGIDFDVSAKDPRVQAIVMMLNTFTEYTPSGRGLHAYLQMTLEDIAALKAHLGGKFIKIKDKVGDDPTCNFYEVLYGFTTFNGSSAAIPKLPIRQVGITEMISIIDAMNKACGNVAAPTVALVQEEVVVIPTPIDGNGTYENPIIMTPQVDEFGSDDAVIERLMRNPEWVALSKGTPQIYHGDTSAADIAFTNYTATETSDAAQIGRILKQYRYREKMERKDYVERTVADTLKDTPIIPQTRPEDIVVEAPTEKKEEVIPDLQIPEDNLARMYTDYAYEVMDSYEAYHLSGFLVLMSNMIKARMEVGGKPLWNNMWIFVVGGTTVSGKTYAFDLIVDLCEVLGLNIAKTPGSSEGLFGYFVKHPTACLFVNECTKLLKLMQQSYGTTIEEDIINLYDHKKSLDKMLADTKIKGEVFENTAVIVNPHVSIYFNTTPEGFAQYAKVGQFSLGMFARPLYLAPTYPKRLLRDRVLDPVIRAEWEAIIKRCVDLKNAVKGRDVVFSLSDKLADYKFDRRAHICDTEHSGEIRGILSRGMDSVYKIAMNLTLCSKEFLKYAQENPEKYPEDELHYKIPDDLAEIAIQMSERHAEYGRQVYMELISSAGPSGKVLKLLKTGDKPRHVLTDACRVNHKAFDELVSHLPVSTYQIKGKAKRATTMYHLEE